MLWGKSNRARYETLIEELRAAGEPTTTADLVRQVPPEENGFPLLEEAAEIFERVNSEHGYPDPVGDPQEVEERLAELEPCYERIDRALRQPHVVSGGNGVGVIQNAHGAVEFRAKARPADSAECIDLLLRLSDRWRPSELTEAVAAGVPSDTAIELLRDAVAGGGLREARPGWLAMLEREEDHGDVAHHLRAERVSVIGVYEAYRRGEDPLDEVRRTRRATREMLEEAGADEALREFDSMFPETPPTPWWTQGWARPFLYRLAAVAVETTNACCAPVTDLRSPPRGAERAYRIKRLRLAASRLARHALQRGDVPIDPATGERFRTERVEGGTRVWSPVADELREKPDPWPDPKLFDWFLPDR